MVRAHYEKEGYLVAKGIFSADDIAPILAEVDRLQALTEHGDPNNLRCRFNPHTTTGKLVLDSLDPVIDLSAPIAELAKDRRLTDLIAQLYGEPACLFKDKVLFKPPGAPGYSLHQDFISWPIFPKTFMTALIALDPSTLANGCLEVFPGEHMRGYLSAPDGDYHDLSPLNLRSQAKVSVELEPGDVLLFGCFLPHQSAPNRSDRPRRHLYLSYNALSDGGPRRTRHYDYFLHWLKRRYAEYGYVSGYFK